jgi:acyl phosphate:glycerol-3-phosphate acyltransferase
VLGWGGGPVAVAIFVMGALLIYRHAANIQKLLKGTESKLGQKAAGAAAGQAHTNKHSSKHPNHSHKHGAHKP